ncbi:6-pyruvoyl trahydropterin synthase family protein [Siphonobacter curvatus]|uniref:6-carboxy-5,6,7,8-tetrahydropterin synthase n=1 Tax=Siphonobacter curvatus TaxID=2094562 RepID=A0A2S7IPN4_9BACT|nr:6-carboxytetrahydropterin synthase [Siphonobacter curvatus]PQA59540.1 6-carboxytetrahydropterin synthase QueD [Siphonobacter curvatus]
MVYVSRVEHFNAAHRVYNPSWSDEQNFEVFGPCANPYYHGHNFELTVTVKGIPHSDTGFVMDMKHLGKIVKEQIVERVDHRNLNLEVDFLKDKIPTCEIFIMEIWKILAPVVAESTQGRSQLHSLKLIETPKNFVEYFGE